MTSQEYKAMLDVLLEAMRKVDGIIEPHKDAITLEVQETRIRVARLAEFLERLKRKVEKLEKKA